MNPDAVLIIVGAILFFGSLFIVYTYKDSRPSENFALQAKVFRAVGLFILAVPVVKALISIFT